MTVHLPLTFSFFRESNSSIKWRNNKYLLCIPFEPMLVLTNFLESFSLSLIGFPHLSQKSEPSSHHQHPHARLNPFATLIKFKSFFPIFSLGELSVSYCYMLIHFEIKLSEFMYHLQSEIVTFSQAKIIVWFHSKEEYSKNLLGGLSLSLLVDICYLSALFWLFLKGCRTHWKIC